MLAGSLLLTTALSLVALIPVFPQTDRTTVQITRLGTDGDTVTEADPSDGRDSAPPPSTEGRIVGSDGTVEGDEGTGEKAEPTVEWAILDELGFGEISPFRWAYKPAKASAPVDVDLS